MKFLISVMFLLSSAAAFGGVNDINVITSPATKYALTNLARLYNGQPNNKSKVNLELASPTELKNKVINNEDIDLVVVGEAIMDELIKKGKIQPEAKGQVASVGIGLVIMAGALNPDISTPETFKQTLLNAKSLVYTSPTAGGAGGIHFEKVIKQLGIADEIAAKAIVNTQPHIESNGAIVARGGAELGVILISEIPSSNGVQLVGPFPKELQSITKITSGIVDRSTKAKQVLEFLKFVASPIGSQILEEAGMEPAAP